MNTPKSPLIVYLDEAGDHSLESIDTSFPVFVLVLFICDVETYSEKIVPAVYRLKFDFFGYEGVILHSRDIRKAQKEFGFYFYRRDICGTVIAKHEYGKKCAFHRSDLRGASFGGES